MGTGPDDGLAPGEPVDTHVQETSDQGAKHSDEAVPKSVNHRLPCRTSEPVREIIEYVYTLGPLCIGLLDLEDFL
jgi:hypothetical protein